MAKHESSVGFFSSIAIGVPLIVVTVVGGMVKIPPYFANREVQKALETTVREVEPYNDDSTIVAAINSHLNQVKASRYWVEDGHQRESLELRITGDQVTIQRDGNRSMAIDINYTQEMWVPLLGRTDVQPFHVHAEAVNNH